MTAASYVAYLNRYCDTFGLWSHISFGKTVTSVQKVDDGSFTIMHVDATNECRSEVFDFVVVCSGLHNVPKLPRVKGLDNFAGKVIHSSEYKEPSIFHNKRVLIVGSGETGAFVRARFPRSKHGIAAEATENLQTEARYARQLWILGTGQ